MSGTRGYRVGVVGATSLLGKDLAEELPESGLANARVQLLDEDEDAAAQLTAVGEDAAVVEALGASSFEGLDFAMFAGSPATTKEHWKAARRAGAGIVDLTYALDGEKEVLVRAPGVQRELQVERAGAEPDLQTAAVVAAHPAAVMLALVGGRLGRAFAVETIAATLLQPASEEGRAGMDELHQQTVSLLSFQPLPKDQFDVQVAFNMVPEFGAEAKAGTLAGVRSRVERHYALLGGGTLPVLTLTVAHAPVFHGLVASAFVQLREPVTTDRVREALDGGYARVASATEEDLPNNLQAAGQRHISLSVRSATERDASRMFWVWMAADNLRLHASNAIACALELGHLRPTGKVQ